MGPHERQPIFGTCKAVIEYITSFLGRGTSFYGVLLPVHTNHIVFGSGDIVLQCFIVFLY